MLGANVEGRMAALAARKAAARQAAREAQRQITNDGKRRKRLAQRMAGFMWAAVSAPPPIHVGPLRLVAPRRSHAMALRV